MPILLTFAIVMAPIRRFCKSRSRYSSKSLAPRCWAFFVLQSGKLPFKRRSIKKCPRQYTNIADFCYCNGNPFEDSVNLVLATNLKARHESAWAFFMVGT